MVPTSSVDSTGQLLLGGVIEGDLDLGGVVTKATDGRAFFFKTAADGRVRWSYRIGGTNSDEIAGVAVLPGDQVVAVGDLSKVTTAGTVSLGLSGTPAAQGEGVEVSPRGVDAGTSFSSNWSRSKVLSASGFCVVK